MSIGDSVLRVKVILAAKWDALCNNPDILGRMMSNTPDRQVNPMRWWGYHLAFVKKCKDLGSPRIPAATKVSRTYSPLNWGFLFSMNAAMPSFASFVLATFVMPVRSISS
jgi:hypothetical protein